MTTEEETNANANSNSNSNSNNEDKLITISSLFDYNRLVGIRKQ